MQIMLSYVLKAIEEYNAFKYSGAVTIDYVRTVGLWNAIAKGQKNNRESFSVI